MGVRETKVQKSSCQQQHAARVDGVTTSKCGEAIELYFVKMSAEQSARCETTRLSSDTTSWISANYHLQPLKAPTELNQ